MKIFAGLLLGASCVAALPWIVGNQADAARRRWKDDAIPAIAAWAADGIWRAQEIEMLARRTNDQRVIAEGWLTDRMILMQSGEWLVNSTVNRMSA